MTLTTEICDLLKSLKRSQDWQRLRRDWAKHADPVEHGETPYVQVTIGANDDLTDWGWQTGDNSYTGGAYGYRHWGIVYLTSRSNCLELAKDCLAEIKEQIAASS
jgi:hypothetical protein